jgi:hypothetical protein
MSIRGTISLATIPHTNAGYWKPLLLVGRLLKTWTHCWARNSSYEDSPPQFHSIRILIIQFSLENETNFPSTVSAAISVLLSTKLLTAPVPPLFHVNRLFRTEAMELAAHRDFLAPLLASTRTTKYMIAVEFLGRSLYKCFIRSCWRAGSHILAIRRPKQCLFNPQIDLLSLDVRDHPPWSNAVLRVSLEPPNKTRYL